MISFTFRVISKLKTDSRNARFTPIANSIPSVLYLNASLTRDTEWNTWISFLTVAEACFFMAANRLTVSQLSLTNVRQVVMSRWGGGEVKGGCMKVKFQMLKIAWSCLCTVPLLCHMAYMCVCVALHWFKYSDPIIILFCPAHLRRWNLKVSNPLGLVVFILSGNNK